MLGTNKLKHSPLPVVTIHKLFISDLSSRTCYLNTHSRDYELAIHDINMKVLIVIVAFTAFVSTAFAANIFEFLQANPANYTYAVQAIKIANLTSEFSSGGKSCVSFKLQRVI